MTSLGFPFEFGADDFVGGPFADYLSAYVLGLDDPHLVQSNRNCKRSRELWHSLGAWTAGAVRKSNEWTSRPKQLIGISIETNGTSNFTPSGNTAIFLIDKTRPLIN
jgi:hypothetical protein